MNKELELQINKVKELIKNHEDVKEYNLLHKEVISNPFIKKSEQLLKDYQKEMVNLTNEEKQEEYIIVKDKYLRLKKEFDEYPLLVNYLQAKEKVNDLLLQISEILSDL